MALSVSATWSAGSSRGELLGDDFAAPYVAKGKMTGTGVGNQAAWSLIFRAYIPDYAVVVTLLVITVICEGAAPFVKVIYHGDDEVSKAGRHHSRVLAI